MTGDRLLLMSALMLFSPVACAVMLRYAKNLADTAFTYFSTAAIIVAFLGFALKSGKPPYVALGAAALVALLAYCVAESALNGEEKEDVVALPSKTYTSFSLRTPPQG
jgi:hypothetical protein